MRRNIGCVFRALCRESRGRLAVSTAIGAFAIGVFFTTAASAQDQEYVWDGVERVVVFADVHGAYQELLAVLQAANVIDENHKWIGASTHLVSVGDLLDRGPNSRMVMDLLRRLDTEAEAAGGDVHVVLGNHEVMNLLGDLRYVSTDEYADYVDLEPPGVRESAFDAFSATLEESEAADAQARFDLLYPPGFFGHLRAFAADGEYGQWLLSLPTIILVNKTAYVHGGLPSLVARNSLAAINHSVQSDLKQLLEVRSKLVERGVLPRYDPRNDTRLVQFAQRQMATQDPEAKSSELGILLAQYMEIQDSTVLGSQGPLWYRGAMYCKPILERDKLISSLGNIGASRVVVGHTPTSNRRAQELYDGQLIMLDTGMLSSYYKGRPTAMISDSSGDWIQYANPTERAEVLPGRREIGYGLTRIEAVEALTNGEIIVPDGTALETGARLRVDYEGRAVDAVYFASDRSSAAEHEASSFALDNLLGFELVPPTVMREVAGQMGAVQLVYPDAISEQTRLDQNSGIGAWCSIQEQLQLVYAFDLLIANTGRNATNLKYREEASNVVLNENGNAFGTVSRLPSGIAEGAVQLGPVVVASLQNLTEESVSAAVDHWLSSREIKSLLSRRDDLVDRFASD